MLERQRSLLIVTDIQGKLARLMFQREELFRNIGIIIDGCKILGVPILWIEQYPDGLGATVEEIASHLEGLSPLSKKTFSALRDERIRSGFMELNRDQILMTGIEAHICIYQTSMDMLSRGFETHVLCDAVSSRTETNKNIGLEKIIRAGGHLSSVETVLFELLGEAEGEQFKQILNLVK
jgi:hypothetical protein